MRRFLAFIFLGAAALTVWHAPSLLFAQIADETVTIYDARPAHPWNQLTEALLVRDGPTGVKYGVDSLDPLLWGNTKHLLEPASHCRALQILDMFLGTHAENLIRDPLKRAILQRDLWAVFDWSVQRRPIDERGAGYQKEQQELQIRLAEVLRRLALTSTQIASLADNYAQAVASGRFATEYDPAHRDLAFLPPDLFDSHGPWVPIMSSGSEPVAPEHVSEFSGRSRFLVFARLPAGRQATLEYFRMLWNAPQPWVSLDEDNHRVEINPGLPQFPPGTQVALVRQMALFDDHGTLIPAPITESVQIRVYRSITAGQINRFESEDFQKLFARTGQDFYEFRLSRALLFAGTAGGLRATARDEREFSVRADDPFEPEAKNLFPLRLQTQPVFVQCAVCHTAGGINSVESRSALFKPNPIPGDLPSGVPTHWWQYDQTIEWKAKRYDWGVLNGYWEAGGKL